ncbi:DMT family transporter [Mesorhizobium muleiense]|uniref:DMT family transporter n=1 Tax=Mesorhizobium muleiense TaxID=1004279 RepID=UPI0039AF7A41
MTGFAPAKPDEKGRRALWRGTSLGMILVFLAALCWSFGGAIARFVDVDDAWTIVFWRSLWAATFIVGFMLWRDGFRGTFQSFSKMGLPGLAVAGCFAVNSTAFVIALSYTTVANILLIQAAVPLFAALIAFVALGERIAGSTWFAIVAVIAGIAVMVSDSLGGSVSLIGNGLALMIAFGFAIATVITRRCAQIPMMSATCLGTVLAGIGALTRASGLLVSSSDMMLLFAFGAINLGLGLALFVSGARLVPAASAALLSTFEPILGPIWVWFFHAEIPSGRTIAGGAMVVAALLAFLMRGLVAQARTRRRSFSEAPGAK